jgi:cytochrome b subunit of formate dehydrogenase
VKITAMHELPPGVVPDFEGSYHGLAGGRGDRRVANCASCHGFHEILPSTNPLSPVFAGNLARTCGECHPGAQERFARGGVHHTTRTWGHWLVDVVGNAYAGMIGMVISLMALHNALDFRKRWRDRRRRGHAVAEKTGSAYLRFTLNERIQHWVLAASFTTLALTGFALRRGWAWPGLAPEWQEPLRATAHRAAAVVFIALALYHVAYLALTRRGREQAAAILPKIRGVASAACCMGACMRMGPPRPDDWREMVATVKYNLGLTAERPRYGRYTYWERLEYWGVVWGGLVMAATGLALWLMVPYLNRFPYWSLELWRTVHLYEATLAVLFIAVSHLYFVVVNPDVFPLNRAMTRGTLTAAEMEQEHGRELESLGNPRGAARSAAGGRASG